MPSLLYSFLPFLRWFPMTRDGLRSDLLAGITVASLAAMQGWAVPADRPNVLFLFTDDQRDNTFGAMGHPWVKTPNVDALAERGLRYDFAWSTLPVCAGFGIRSGQDVANVGRHAAGAIVGSALVEVLERGEDPQPFLESLVA